MKRAVVMLLIALMVAFAAPAAHAEDELTKKTINDIIKDQDGTYSVAILDLETGDCTLINPDETFHWASTVKLPLVLYTFIQVGQGNVSLADRIAYTADDYEAGSGTLQASVKVGDRFTIDYLTRVAIRNSDNIAKLMLLHRFGRPTIEAWAETLGGHFKQEGMCAPEMLIYLKYIYEHRSEPLMQRFIDDLNHTNKKRMGRLIPTSVVLAAKTGSLPGEFHNAGIIFTERPVAVSIYSKGTTEYGANHIEGLIGKAVYDQYRRRVCPQVFYRGSIVEFGDDRPFIYHGRTIVPLRRFAEAAGIAVAWDETSQAATLTGDGTSVSFQIGSDSALVAGEPDPVPLGERVLLIRGRTYIPLRGISEGLGLTVDWDAGTNSVVIK